MHIELEFPAFRGEFELGQQAGYGGNSCSSGTLGIDFSGRPSHERFLAPAHAKHLAERDAP